MGVRFLMLFLPAYPLGVLNVEAFIRLEAPCEVLAEKCGRTTAFDINLHFPDEEFHQHRDDMFEIRRTEQ